MQVPKVTYQLVEPFLALLHCEYNHLLVTNVYYLVFKGFLLLLHVYNVRRVWKSGSIMGGPGT
jgi:hypothetical protein